jgi:hypothetical protein
MAQATRVWARVYLRPMSATSGGEDRQASPNVLSFGLTVCFYIYLYILLTNVYVDSFTHGPSQRTTNSKCHHVTTEGRPKRCTFGPGYIYVFGMVCLYFLFISYTNIYSYRCRSKFIHQDERWAQWRGDMAQTTHVWA